MKTTKYIVLILVALTTKGLYAQKELSLSDAITIGLENNYDLKIVKKSEEIASLSNNWGNAGALPSVNFLANGGENYNVNDKEDFRTETFSPEVRLNWVVFNGFSARITRQKLEMLEQQSKGNTAVLVESTIQNIILAYNTCLLQKQMVEVFKELNSLSEDRFKRVGNSKEIGASTTYEMLQAKTSWLEDQSHFLQQKVNYENAVRNLNFLMGVENDKYWILTSPLESQSFDYQLEDLTHKLLSNNKTLRNQYINQSLLAKETALARSRYSPTLSLNNSIGISSRGNFYHGDTPNLNQNSTDAFIGLSLSFNIFNGGTTRRSVQIAKIHQETSRVQTIKMEHSLKNRLLQLYSNYNVQKNILQLADEKEVAARLNLDLSEAKLKNGSINSFNYRDVQIIYLNAALNKLQAVYNLIEFNTELLRITGGIISPFSE